MGIFEMKERGLEEVLNPSELFQKNDLRSSRVGCCRFNGRTRPVLVEPQAQSVQRALETLEEWATGVDHNRVSLIMAVLEKRVGMLHAESRCLFKSSRWSEIR